MSPDCRKCRQYISAYLDGETSQAEEQFIRQHTQTCPECREAWRAYQGIRSQFQNLSQPIPSPALRQAVLVGVRNGSRVADVRRQPNRGGLLAGGLFGRSLRVGMGLVTAAVIFVIAVAVLIASIVTTPKTFEVVANATDQLQTGRNYISLKFTRPVDEAELRQHLNISVPVKVEVIGDGTEARLTPLQDLTPNQTVNISIEGLRDKNNEPLKNNKVDLVYKVVDPTATAVPPTTTPKPPTFTPKPNQIQQTTTIALPTSTPKPSQPTTTVAAPATPTPPPAITVTPIPAPKTTKPAVTTTSVPLTTTVITTTSPPTQPLPSPSVTVIATVTVSPSVTATTTVTASPSVTASTTPAPTTITATMTTPAPATTPAPTTVTTTVAATTTPVPGAACAIQPVSGFGLVYTSTSGLPVKMGCPTEHEHNILMAHRAFEYGFMFYQHQTEQIWVFYNRTSTWDVYANDNSTTPPASYGTKPPPGRYEPDLGFGKVWYNNKLQSKLGWSTEPQEYTNGLGAAQLYERGMMLFTPGGELDGHKHIYVLYNDHTFINVIGKT